MARLALLDAEASLGLMEGIDGESTAFLAAFRRIASRSINEVAMSEIISS